MGRYVRALDVGIQSDRGKESRTRLIAKRPGLSVISQRSGEGGIADDKPLLEAIELRVVVERPPAVARQPVGWTRLRPGSEFLVGVAAWNFRHLKRRRERAATKQQRQRRALKCSSSHVYLCPLAGALRFRRVVRPRGA